MKDRAVAMVVDGDKDNGRLLVMHVTEPDKQYYTLPGGGVEPGETVEEAVVREIAEEAMLEIEIQHLAYIHHYDDGTSQFYYYCTYVSGTPQLDPNSPEFLKEKDKFKPMWLPIDKLPSTLLYPLEVRDWITEDHADGFKKKREITMKISDLRQTF